MVLTAVSQELDAEATKQIHLVEGLMAQHVKNKSDHFSDLYDRVMDYRRILEYDETSVQKEASAIERLTQDPEIDKLISRYKEMVADGSYEAANKRAIEATEKYLNRPVQGFKVGDKLTWSTNKELEKRATEDDAFDIQHNDRKEDTK